ncbi:unnamed protein product [Auanema sp. JU1783]|nr:unnamed protein product [Auanema sp. JU1783]
MSTDNSQVVKKVAIAAAVGVGAVGIAYLISKKLRSGPTFDANSLTIDELKQLGNTFFSEKKYAEAIQAFTAAINKGARDKLGSICYQNRAAAKERVGGHSLEDIVSDCEKAIELNPQYGKAYWRKARLQHQLKHYSEALTSVFCASYLDASFSSQATEILYKILGNIQDFYKDQWSSSVINGSGKHVRHERVFVWLHKTVLDDPIRSLILSWDRKTSTQFGNALTLIAELKYDDVAAEAEKEEGENKLEALLLAARFYTYQNLMEDAERCLNLFDTEWEKLDDTQKGTRKPVLSSKHLICIEKAHTLDEIKRAFLNALSTDIRNADFYSAAAFRLVLADEKLEALKILNTEGVSNDNITLLNFTLKIMMGTASQDPSVLINTIKALEEFCNGLDNKSMFSKILLAKVYATFGNDESAREIMDGLIKQYPNLSILYYDRGCMARDRDEAVTNLNRCLEIEPHHSEANLMLGSLLLDEMNDSLKSPDCFKTILDLINRAESTFDSTIDFPVLDGVFRMKAIIEAKKNAARLLNVQ